MIFQTLKLGRLSAPHISPLPLSLVKASPSLFTILLKRPAIPKLGSMRFPLHRVEQAEPHVHLNEEGICAQPELVVAHVHRAGRKVPQPSASNISERPTWGGALLHLCCTRTTRLIQHKRTGTAGACIILKKGKTHQSSPPVKELQSQMEKKLSQSHVGFFTSQQASNQ